MFLYCMWLFFFLFFFLMILPTPISTLFPYTTLFRSGTLKTYAPRAKKIHIEIDPSEIHKNVFVDVPLVRSEEHTSELQSRRDLVCRLLLEKKKINSWKNDVNDRRNMN